MSDPQAMHWRRHDMHAVVDRGSSPFYMSDVVTVIASACGRLVDYQQATPDASEADCSECEQVWGALQAYNPEHRPLCRKQRGGSCNCLGFPGSQP